MCGRFALHSKQRISLRGWPSLDLPFEARYNIAPGQDVFCVRIDGNGVTGRMLKWGLIPSWSVDGKGFINARSETILAKPSFSESFRLRRCLIPASGFFEWKRQGKEKRPFYIAPDEKLLMFAGIWDTWRNGGSETISCSIITTAPNSLVSELHDRMPAILRPDVYESWLDMKTDYRAALAMLEPCSSSSTAMYPVSRKVNAVENDSSELVTPVSLESGQTLRLF